MAYQVAMSIGGVRIEIACADAPILGEHEAHYRPFVRPAEQVPSPADIHIRLVLGNLPDTAAMQEVFNTDESWALLSEGERRFIVLQPAAFDAPLWVARFDDGPANITIFCGPRLVQAKDGRACVSNPVRYPLDQILLMYFLAPRRGALIHAAGVGIGGRGFIFPGRSGAGKSTLTRQLAHRPDLHLLSDDRIIIRKCENDYRAYGTPWPGEANVATNDSLPLRGIVFIRHGPENTIREMSNQTALENLLPVTSIPWYDRDVMLHILSFCEEMFSDIPAYELHFKPTIEVADVLAQLVSG
ncbi:MAG: hypothetical protein AB1696_16935 [Planctomycetota bacterium]